MNLRLMTETDDIGNMSPQALKARNRLLLFGLAIILNLIFEPSIVLPFSVIEIQKNKELIPFVLLIGLFILLIRYVSILTKDYDPENGFFRHEHEVTVFSKKLRAERLIKKYYDKDGQVIVNFVNMLLDLPKKIKRLILLDFLLGFALMSRNSGWHSLKTKKLYQETNKLEKTVAKYRKKSLKLAYEGRDISIRGQELIASIKNSGLPEDSIEHQKKLDAYTQRMNTFNQLISPEKNRLKHLEKKQKKFNDKLIYSMWLDEKRVKANAHLISLDILLPLIFTYFAIIMLIVELTFK